MEFFERHIMTVISTDILYAVCFSLLIKYREPFSEV